MVDKKPDIKVQWYGENIKRPSLSGNIRKILCNGEEVYADENLLVRCTQYFSSIPSEPSDKMLKCDLVEAAVMRKIIELLKEEEIDCTWEELKNIAYALKVLSVHPYNVHDDRPVIRVRSDTYRYRRNVRGRNILDIILIALNVGIVRANREILRARSKKLETDLQRGDLVKFHLHVETKKKLKSLIDFMQCGSAILRVWNHSKPESDFEEFCKLLIDFDVVDRGHEGEARHILRSTLTYGSQKAANSKFIMDRGSVHPPQVNPDNQNPLILTLSWNTQPSTVTPNGDRLVTLKCRDQEYREPVNILEAGSRVIASTTRKGLMTPVEVDAEPHILDAVLKLIKEGTIVFKMDRPGDLNDIAKQLRELRVHPPGVNDKCPVITVSSEAYRSRSKNIPYILNIELFALNGYAVGANRRILRARSKKLETDLERGDLVKFYLHVETKKKLKSFIDFMQCGSAKLRVWNYRKPESDFEEFSKLLIDFAVVDRGHEGEELHEALKPLVGGPHKATKSNSKTYRGIDHPRKGIGKYRSTGKSSDTSTKKDDDKKESEPQPFTSSGLRRRVDASSQGIGKYRSTGKSSDTSTKKDDDKKESESQPSTSSGHRRRVDVSSQVSGVPTVSYTDRQSKFDIHQNFQGNYDLALESPLVSHQSLQAQQQARHLHYRKQQVQQQLPHLHYRKQQVQQQLPQLSNSSHSSQDTQENYQRKYNRSSEEYVQNQNMHYLSDIPEKNNLSQTQSYENVGPNISSHDLSSHKYSQYPQFSFTPDQSTSLTWKETSSLPHQEYTQRPSLNNNPAQTYWSITTPAVTESSQGYSQDQEFPFLQNTGMSHTYPQQDAQNATESFRSPTPSAFPEPSREDSQHPSGFVLQGDHASLYRELEDYQDYM